MEEILTVAFGYVVGSVPFAFLLSRRRGIDLRDVGSDLVLAELVGRAEARRLVLRARAAGHGGTVRAAEEIVVNLVLQRHVQRAGLVLDAERPELGVGVLARRAVRLVRAVLRAELEAAEG